MDAEDEYLAVYSRVERGQSRFRRMSGAALTGAANWMRRFNADGIPPAANGASIAPPSGPTPPHRNLLDHRNAATLLGLREIAARLDGGVHPGD